MATTITIDAGKRRVATVTVAAPTDDAYDDRMAITNSIESAVEANAGTAGALENLVLAADTSVSTDVSGDDATPVTVDLGANQERRGRWDDHVHGDVDGWCCE